MTRPMVPPALTVKVAFPERAWLESETLSATSAASNAGAPLQAPQPETLRTIPSAGRFPTQIPLRLAVGDAFGARVLAGPADVGVNGVPVPVPGPQAGQSAAQVARTSADGAGRVITL